MLKLFTPWLKKTLSSVVATSLLAVSIPFSATSALAGPSCANADAANRGLDPDCAARVVGNQIITFPRTNWALLGVIDIPAPGSSSNNVNFISGSEVKTLGNTPASVLKLSADEVISMVNQVPTNVPYVFGRFNPLSGTLRVDLMKVEETMTSSGKKLGLYHSIFTPKHGDYWKAARMYISPDQYETGTVPGRNPFEPFRQGDDDLFYNVTQEASQVVVGHAMRFTGAPVGVLQIAIPRVAVTQKKSKSFLKTKITTTWTGYLKPSWWIAYPNSVLSRDETRGTMRYCVNDVKSEKAECPAYEMATTGVAFEEFKGGMLDETEESWVLRQQTKSGWNLLGLLLIVGVLTGIGFLVMSAIAPTYFAATAGLLNSGFAALGLASVGGFSAGVGLATLQMTLATAGVMLFGGANLNGVYSLDARTVMFGSVNAINTSPPKEQDQDYKKLSSEYAEPRTVSDFVRGGLTLNSFRKTITGNCSMSASVQDCTVEDGVSPRTTREQTASPASVTANDVGNNNVSRVPGAGAKFEGGTRYR